MHHHPLGLISHTSVAAWLRPTSSHRPCALETGEQKQMRGASRWVQAGAPPANLRLKPVALKLCSRTAELHGTTQQPTCIALPGVHYHINLAAARQEALHSTRGTAPMAPKHRWPPPAAAAGGFRHRDPLSLTVVHVSAASRDGTRPRTGKRSGKRSSRHDRARRQPPNESRRVLSS